jgi:hypothetical protein
MAVGGTAGTIAAIVSAAAAVGGVTHGVIEGERAKTKSKRSLADQQRAQSDARNKAAADTANAERQNRKAARASADVGGLLTDAQLLAAQGLGATNTSGAQGVDPNRLKLSKASLLGG